MKKSKRLGDLEKGEKAIILQTHPGKFSARLLEMGLLEGSIVEVMHEGPFGGDPFAIKVRGTLLALQRELANSIEVLVYGPDSSQ